MSKATNRKLVRAAIVETAEALTALKPEWERRDDLKLMVEGVERAINEALKLLQNSAPTEQVREAQVAAYTSLEGLREALAKPAGAAPVAKPVVRRTRGQVAPVETRELFRDDQAGVIVTWILDPAEPKFVVTHSDAEEEITLLELRATRAWASEKKQAIETGRKKACEVLGLTYVESQDSPVVTRTRGKISEQRKVVFGEGGPVQVVSVVAGAETRYELVVGDEVKASAPANRSTWREVKAGLIQQAAKLVAATA